MKMKLLIFLTMLFAVASMVSAQDEPKKTLTQLTDEYEKNYAVGFGSYFSEEQATFGGDALFLNAKLHGFELPNMPVALDVASGTRIEFGKSALGTSVGDVHVRVYSMNRVRLGRVETGMDAKVMDSDGWNFDFVVPVTYLLSKNFEFEVFFLEEERPIAFALNYRF